MVKIKMVKIKIELYNDTAANVLVNVLRNPIENAIILTDPPYDFTLDEMASYSSWFNSLVGLKAWKIIFCPPENQWVYIQEETQKPQYLFWEKPISTKNTSKTYSRFIEIIKVYGKGYWNPRNHWSNYVNIHTDRVEGKIIHPFQKPLALATRLILNHTRPGDTVIDPFMGSGIFGVAAKLAVRNYIGIERAPLIYEGAKKLITNAGTFSNQDIQINEENKNERGN